MNRKKIARELAARELTAGGVKRWLEDLSEEMGLKGEITEEVMKEAQKRMKKVRVKKGRDLTAATWRTGLEFLKWYQKSLSTDAQGIYDDYNNGEIAWRRVVERMKDLKRDVDVYVRYAEKNVKEP